MANRKLEMPECLGYWENNSNGIDFDCEYPNPPECDECLCNYYTRGGTVHPDTKYRYSIKFLERNFGKINDLDNQ